jgi:hypothetical protein
MSSSLSTGTAATSTETTRDEVMQLLLTSPKYSDITLKGTDGVVVHANRCLLAARSTVFDKMLYGQFSEATKSVVELPYSGEVLENLVSYIYTDKADLLNMEEVATMEGTFAPIMFALIDAATYFELPSLRNKTEELACSTMEKNPAFGIACLYACEQFPSIEDSRAKDNAWALIRSNPKVLLKENVVCFFSPRMIESFLQDQNLATDELTLFKILQEWSLVEDERASTNTELNSSSRKRKASELTKYILLEQIEPIHLSTTVASSGLISDSRLLETFKAQALLAAEKHSVPYYRSSRAPVWRSSGESVLFSNSASPAVEFLSCPVLRSGIHKWSIKVEKKGFKNGTWIGVASTEHKINCNQWLGCQDGGWVYSDDGDKAHYAYLIGDRSSGSHAKFKEGSIVTLTLDLTGPGILNASVNGSPPAELFNDMLSKFDDGGAVGFLPAVSLCQKVQVRLLEFERVA